MKRFSVAAGALTSVLLIAVPAGAFEFTGSEAAVQYHNWFTSGPQKGIANANVGFELGDGLYGQVGATSALLFGAGGGLDFGSLDAHVGWRESDAFAAGGFVGLDSYITAGAPYDYHFGAEAAFTLGQVKGEVFAGRYVEAADPDLELFAGGDLEYAVNDRFSIGAGAFLNTEPGSWTEIYLDASARYTFDNNWFVEGIYSWQPQFGEHGVGVRIGFTFDRGVSFGNRNFTSLANSFY